MLLRAESVCRSFSNSVFSDNWNLDMHGSYKARFAIKNKLDRNANSSGYRMTFYFCFLQYNTIVDLNIF